MDTIDEQKLEEFLKTPHTISPEDKQKIQDTILSHMVTTFWDDMEFLKKVNRMTFGLIKGDNIRPGF